MNLISKIRFKFNNLLKFEKLNPMDNFEFDGYIESRISNDNIELFKKIVQQHVELREVIWIGIYHCLNTFNLKNEFLTVLSSNYDVIVDLLEGDDKTVVFRSLLNWNIKKVMF